jgi:hypothetical protein
MIELLNVSCTILIGTTNKSQALTKHDAQHIRLSTLISTSDYMATQRYRRVDLRLAKKRLICNTNRDAYHRL